MSTGKNDSSRRRKWLRIAIRSLLVLLVLQVVTGAYHVWKPLPPGVSFAGPYRNTSEIRFLGDLSWMTQSGQRRMDQEIFDAVFEMIDQAESFILIDMFLFNDFMGAESDVARPLSGEMTSRLIAKKQSHPNVELHLITDPINTVYGGFQSEQLSRLRHAGVQVTMTRLNRLRDSNPVYSSFWRLWVRPFGNSPGSLMPNPFGDGRVSLRSWLALMNFKANHRKTIVADRNGELVALVTSANPHDASSAHGNVALQFKGRAALDLLEAEKAVIAFSGGPEVVFEISPATQTHDGENLPLQVAIRSEGAIRNAVLEAIDAANQGDELELLMFYLSDRAVVRSLIRARERGVAMRVILDPNKDAFGRMKNGVPNRQVAAELVDAGIPVRWAATHGEQCHGKLLVIRKADGSAWMTLGSANFTRRNLKDLNLELNAVVAGPADKSLFQDAGNYFNQLWSNDDGREFTVPYSKFSDAAWIRKWQYRFMESTGISTF